jgi:RNA polymerase sigma-70 factor (ECF subfamily)
VGPVSDQEEAYRTFGPALLRKAERVLRSREDARDVVQNLFVELWQRGMHDVDLPYLYRAVTNRCLNLIRDVRNRERLLEREQTALVGPARVRCDDRVIGLQLMTRLAERLDVSHMEVLVCRFFDDMSQEEIAEHLDLSRKTIGKRLQRIRDEVAALAEPAPPAASPASGGAA